MPHDVQGGAVQQRSKVNAEPVAAEHAAAAEGRRRRCRRAGVGRTPRQRRVDGRGGRHVRHVEGAGEGVDGCARGLVGEAEQREDAVRDGGAYCSTDTHYDRSKTEPICSHIQWRRLHRTRGSTCPHFYK